MEDYVLPGEVNRSSSKNEISKTKKIFLITSVILFFIAIGIFSFVLGRNTTKESGETPTPSVIPTPTIVQISETPTPVSTSSATPTKKIGLSPTPSPILKSIIIPSTSGLDGFRSSSGGGNNSLEIRAGRNINLVSRGFVSFNLEDIPQGVTIKEAVLKVYQSKIIGSPYSAGGALKLDHLSFGDSLDSSDYGMAALLSNVATLSSNTKIEWKEADVADMVRDDLAIGRSSAQFRIHFTTENAGGDATGDFAYFDSANTYTDNSGNKPQLVIKYQ